jgi:hypothetical protein
VQRDIVESIGEEWLSVILHEVEVSQPSIRTGKTSPDALFEEKKRKSDPLTRKRHSPLVALSADEIGPIPRIPHGGEGRFPRRVPARVPADSGGSSGRSTASRRSTSSASVSSVGSTERSTRRTV